MAIFVLVLTSLASSEPATYLGALAPVHRLFILAVQETTKNKKMKKIRKKVLNAV